MRLLPSSRVEDSSQTTLLPDSKQTLPGSVGKASRAAALAPTVLEAINKTEDVLEQKIGSKKSRRKKKFAKQQAHNQQIRRFAQEARQACQHWMDESKRIPPQEVLSVVEFFLIAIARVIAQRITSEAVFKQEKVLLDMIDDILSCWGDHPDLAFVRLRSKYYRVISYITQQENNIEMIRSLLKEIVAFRCDKTKDLYGHIYLLDALCIGCITWVSKLDWETGDQDKISELMHQIVHKMMAIYESIPSSVFLPGCDLASVYSNLVARAVGLAVYHFIEIDKTPKKESCYRNWVENLMTRLQALLDRHRQMTPSEEECLPVFTLIVDFLKAFKPTDNWLRDSLLKIASDFAPDAVGLQVLAYRATIAVFQKSDKESPLLVGENKLPEIKEKSTFITLDPPHPPPKSSPPLPTVIVNQTAIDVLTVENEKLQQQLQETQQAAKKQQKNLIRKNKRLTQQRDKWEEEKIKLNELLQAKETEIKDLVSQNMQLKTQRVDEAKRQEAMLIKKQAEQDRQNAAQRQQEITWGQRLREQQTALHSVSTKNSLLRKQVADSQSVVKELEKELKQTTVQLTDAETQIRHQKIERECDKTAMLKKTQALQSEVERLRALLSIQRPSSGRGPGFSFS